MIGKHDLARRIASILRANGYKKHIPRQKRIFTINDDSGNSKQFVLQEPDREVIFTVEDILTILDAIEDIAKNALKTGDVIKITGFGTLRTVFRKETIRRNPKTGGLMPIPSHYSPKFTPGHRLKRASEDYSNYLLSKEIDAAELLSPDDGDEFFEDYEEVDPTEEAVDTYEDALDEEEEENSESNLYASKPLKGLILKELDSIAEDFEEDYEEDEDDA